MNEGWVVVHHPDLVGSPAAEVTQQAFDEVWAEKGFVEGDWPEGATGDEPGDTLPDEDN